MPGAHKHSRPFAAILFHSRSKYHGRISNTLYAIPNANGKELTRMTRILKA
jgi:hypothetical protein